MMSESVSVIIPTCNRRSFLKKAIDSVLGQLYRDFELIVVDDGSTDGTDDLVAGYAADIVYLRQANRGAAAARNTGIRAARYDLLTFLDSDDQFAPQKLALQVAAMGANPEFLVSHTDEIWYRRGKLLNQKKKHARNEGLIFDRCLKLCAVGMSTAMVRRRLFEQVGFFDEELPCCEDYDFWLRVSVDHPFLVVAEPLTIKNGGRPDQLSVIHRVGIDKFRIRAIMKVIEAGRLSPLQMAAARDELSRKCRIYGNGCLKHGRPAEGKYYLDLIAELNL
ncbi:MAG: glycosyltransferase [Proteobacteria bacterium]|nr:glycosyltransferase [Pseudomonadota bacterium]MBU1715251.1 glycosyltransferase [Pseudomonadota bacterium]